MIVCKPVCEIVWIFLSYPESRRHFISRPIPSGKIFLPGRPQSIIFFFCQGIEDLIGIDHPVECGLQLANLIITEQFNLRVFSSPVLILVAISDSFTMGLVMLLARKKLHITTTDRVTSVRTKMLGVSPILVTMLSVPPMDTIPRSSIGIMETKSMLTMSL